MEIASVGFPFMRLGSVALFCCCDFRGSKTVWLGFYLLLFLPCFAHGVSLPEGLPGPRGQFAAEALAGGKRKTLIEQERLPLFNLRARKNPPGKAEHPWRPSPAGSPSPRLAPRLKEFLLPLVAPAPASPLPARPSMDSDCCIHRSWVTARGDGAAGTLGPPSSKPPCLFLALVPAGTSIPRASHYQSHSARSYHHGDVFRTSSTFLQSAGKLSPNALI